MIFFYENYSCLITIKTVRLKKQCYEYMTTKLKYLLKKISKLKTILLLFRIERTFSKAVGQEFRKSTTYNLPKFNGFYSINFNSIQRIVKPQR